MPDQSDQDVQHENATVTFDCQTRAVSVDQDDFEVKSGNTLFLTLDLELKGTCEAEFPPGKQSIDFPNGGPSGFEINRDSPTRVVLTEKNSNPKMEPEVFCFKAVVKSGNDTFESPDPTITNLGGGG